MTKLTDEYIAEMFSGAIADPTRFKDLASANRGEFTIPSSRYMDDSDLRELFGITERLRRLWDYNGIRLNVHMKMDDCILSCVRIHKYRDRSGGAGRPLTRDLVPTQQELRVIRRLLEYLTQ